MGTIIYNFVWLSYQEGKWLLSFWVLPKLRESPLLPPSIVHFKHFEMVVNCQLVIYCHLVYNHDCFESLTQARTLIVVTSSLGKLFKIMVLNKVAIYDRVAMNNHFKKFKVNN